jgi:hypothetical protein
MNSPLTCQPPPPRCSLNVRVIRGTAWLMSGSETGPNTASPAFAAMLAVETGFRPHVRAFQPKIV